MKMPLEYNHGESMLVEILLYILIVLLIINIILKSFNIYELKKDVQRNNELIEFLISANNKEFILLPNELSPPKFLQKMIDDKSYKCFSKNYTIKAFDDDLGTMYVKRKKNE